MHTQRWQRAVNFVHPDPPNQELILSDIVQETFWKCSSIMEYLKVPHTECHAVARSLLHNLPHCTAPTDARLPPGTWYFTQAPSATRSSASTKSSMS
jgi:hypothetical protein